ncbi:hypothetical protein [Catenulispora subtropica]|uniref:Uncharacterized protein n=1 Tax=Catenulispora subtropica TaxID=450798 RepID=A0ABP5CR40_9ACTN
MPTHDPYIPYIPYIRDVIAKNHIRPEPDDTDDLDAAVRATDAELRSIAVRQKVFYLWLDEHWTRQGVPAAGADFRLDAYIRALVDRHGLTRQAGEDDAELAHRALAAEVVAEATRCQVHVDWIEANAQPTDARPPAAHRPSPVRPTTAPTDTSKAPRIAPGPPPFIPRSTAA